MPPEDDKPPLPLTSDFPTLTFLPLLHALAFLLLKKLLKNTRLVFDHHHLDQVIAAAGPGAKLIG